MTIAIINMHSNVAMLNVLRLINCKLSNLLFILSNTGRRTEFSFDVNHIMANSKCVKDRSH